MIRSFYNKFADYLGKPASIAPLITFRLVFGGVLFYSTVRMMQMGWVDTLYIQPTFHFSFIDGIKPLDLTGMYAVYSIMALAAVGIIIGLFYRISTAVFFLLFSYCELIDKTFYLNHYYLVAILTFWLALVPANRFYSLDCLIFPKIRSTQCLNWHILIFKVQLSIVYFFAGLAKVNPDWLLRAQPMATWLPGRYDIPVIGQWLHLKSVAYILSWAGCLYDLTIWIFLWMKRLRGWAYFFVVVFHVLTGILFPRIGMFPYIMIFSTIIFFSPAWHEKVLSYLPFIKRQSFSQKERRFARPSNFIVICLSLYLLVQLWLPMRYLIYPGNLFWHEQGYRFSWRVMLIEKSGQTSIIIKDPKKGTQKEVKQDEYLTTFQQQQMRSQPDMILQFARHLGDKFKETHGYNPEIYVKSRLSLNGRRSVPFTNDTIDIYNTPNPMQRSWILPNE